jgi:hypothetical protein
MEVKQAMKDSRFRETLPAELQPEVISYLNNPGCACNLPLYRKILANAQELLIAYYPGREVVNESEEILKLAQNNWSVINCNIEDLEKELKKLAVGRKQLAVARFEDQVTVIVNELDSIY